ncbi:hypothetical protein QR692_10040 [Lactococcus petauri]|uniref:hypothetical protein n=1 Tax=Lactococcus petauri TaxID=1940789 RepID=UPI002078EBED|nr:hypothetical protein [Lactococcus petauri]USI65322.1 hypothetical protein LMK05_10925 [Lactococcus petauri]USI67817.1 hypothetical protein LMK04_10160 [Lactococcus petauri]WJE12478.1 hypothetical protein QR692_10040 [Lactococcus petauri]
MTAKLYNTTWSYNKIKKDYIYLDESSFEGTEEDIRHQNTVQENEIWKQLFSTFVPTLKSIHYKKFGEAWEKSNVYLEFFKVEDNSLLMAVRNWGKPRDENTIFEIKPSVKNTILSYVVTEQGNAEIFEVIFKDGPVQMDKQYFEANFSVQERVEHVVEYYLLNFKSIAAGDYTGELSDSYYDGADSEFQLWDKRDALEEVIDFNTIEGCYSLLEYIYEQFGIDYRNENKMNL